MSDNKKRLSQLLGALVTRADTLNLKALNLEPKPRNLLFAVVCPQILSSGLSEKIGYGSTLTLNPEPWFLLGGSGDLVSSFLIDILVS